jgi:hypothetical protein
METELKLNEQNARELVEQVEGLALCMGSNSAGYGMTIENNARMWRISGWSLDSMAWRGERYGRTFKEAWSNWMDNAEGEDEELAVEWGESKDTLED